jgi:hypothetical protein
MEWMEQSLEMMKSWTDMQKRMSKEWLDAAAGLGKAEGNPLAEWVARWQEAAQKSMDAWEELTRKFAENEGKWAGNEAWEELMRKTMKTQEDWFQGWLKTTKDAAGKQSASAKKPAAPQGGGPATLEGSKGDRVATEAYCMRCRTMRTMKDEKAITMKNGKPATRGVCPTCGTKMFKIGKSK